MDIELEIMIGVMNMTNILGGDAIKFEFLNVSINTVQRKHYNVNTRLFW